MQGHDTNEIESQRIETGHILIYLTSTPEPIFYNKKLSFEQRCVIMNQNDFSNIILIELVFITSGTDD